MVEIAIDIALRGARLAAPWTPATLDPTLWLAADAGTYQDAARTTPATADGDPVGGWADQSGNAHHASQATAGQRPTLQLSEVNGKPVLRFDGGDDFLANAGATLEGAAGVTIAVVGKFTTATSYGMAFSHNDGGIFHEIRQRDATGKMESWFHGTDIVGATDQTGSWDLWVGTYAGGAGGVATFRQNGVLEATGTGTPIPAGGPYGVAARPAGNLFWNGDIAEVVIIPRLCGAAEIEALETHLMDKYGITLP